MTFALARLREDYDVRHTFVSTLIAAGVPLPKVTDYSGHSAGEYLAQLLTAAPRLRAAPHPALVKRDKGQRRAFGTTTFVFTPGWTTTGG